MRPALRIGVLAYIAFIFAVPLNCTAGQYGVADQSQSDSVKQLLNELGKTPNGSDVQAAVVDLQYEAAYCSSLYNVFYAGAVQAGAKPKDTAKLHTAAQDALRLTFVLGQKIGMSEAALEAQDKVDTQRIKDEMHGSWVNAPIVIEKHGPTCKALLERPDSRLSYWLRVERKNGDRARHRK